MDKNMVATPDSTATKIDTVESATKAKGKAGRVILAIVILIVIIWVIVRPGVFAVQPIGALPEGVTFIYHSRGSEMPFFSSPDGLCIKVQGGVSLLCRMATLSAAADLTDRIILRLPYNHWAYLQSTGGREFEN